MDELLKLLGLAPDADAAAIAKAIGALQATATAMATIAKAAGLDEDARAEDVAKAVATAMSAKPAEQIKAIARAAGLPDDAKPAEIETAVAKAVAAGGSADPDPSKFVPRSEFDQVKTALAKLQSDDAEDKALAAAEAAIQDGKVTPGQKDWALAYARKDPAGFAEYVKAAPVIVKPGSADTAGKPKAADAPLDETERAVCRAMGLSEEDFRKSRAQLANAEEEAGR